MNSYAYLMRNGKEEDTNQIGSIPHGIVCLRSTTSAHGSTFCKWDPYFVTRVDLSQSTHVWMILTIWHDIG